LARRRAAWRSLSLMAARYGFTSSRRQKSKQRTRSVPKSLASSMQCSSSASCALKSSSAWKVSRRSLCLDVGAPCQSTLNRGLAMSVNFRLYFARIRFDSAIWFASSVVMFLFHMPRSSIQLRPKSFAATEHEWSKSCEISSLMTATRNGQLAAAARILSGAAQNAAPATAPAINSRREIPMETSVLRANEIMRASWMRRGWRATPCPKASPLLVFFRLPGARIGHAEGAVGMRHYLEVCAVLRGAFGIRDQGLGAVVRRVG